MFVHTQFLETPTLTFQRPQQARARAATLAAAMHAASMRGQPWLTRAAQTLARFGSGLAAAALPSAVFALTCVCCSCYHLSHNQPKHYGTRFLQWWYAAGPGHAGEGPGTVAVPPPPCSRPPLPGRTSAVAAGQCAACLRPRLNPAVLGASGFVFCYRCVHDHVDRHGVCPVTGVPAALSQIVRLHLGT
jgi:hypothetical protein